MKNFIPFKFLLLSILILPQLLLSNIEIVDNSCETPYSISQLESITEDIDYSDYYSNKHSKEIYLSFNTAVDGNFSIELLKDNDKKMKYKLFIGNSCDNLTLIERPSFEYTHNVNLAITKNKDYIIKVVKHSNGNSRYNISYNFMAEEEEIHPVISNIKLNGLDEVTIIQGEEYKEWGLDGYRDNEFEIIGEVDTSTIGQYILKYIVQNKNTGYLEITTSRIVNVVSMYGVDTKVYGHTATFGKRSTINLRLRSKPIADVKISFDSSNLNEGEIWGDKTIIFTPDNWKRGQSITIKGKNLNPIDDKQDYNITFEPIISEDSNYNEIKLDNIAMKGIILELEQPINIGYFISSVDKTIEFKVKYNGSKRDLKYKLIDAPDGIKFVSGYNILNEGYILYTPPTPEDTITKYIRWEAPQSSEGKIYTITLEVTDGKITKEMNFDIKVATSRILETDFDGEYLTIVDDNTDLKGIKIKFESDNQELPILRTVDAKYMEAPKNGIRVGSDYLFSTKRPPS